MASKTQLTSIYWIANILMVSFGFRLVNILTTFVQWTNANANEDNVNEWMLSGDFDRRINQMVGISFTKCKATIRLPLSLPLLTFKNVKIIRNARCTINAKIKSIFNQMSFYSKQIECPICLVCVLLLEL